MTEPAPEPDSGLDQRVAKLEEGQTSILSKLNQLLTGPVDPPEPERPEINIQEEIRRQLAAARAKDKPKAEPAAARPEPEQPPKPPIRRVTKLIWGDDD
jgi:hypothetical protein